jgi:8-oxo-dGTP pyrophosphatase MutT (NUDIX family)
MPRASTLLGHRQHCLLGELTADAGRVEFFNDPRAPRANSLVIAVTAVIVNDQGELLLQKHTDNNLWGLPGGAMDIGESIREAVIREVKEETALDVDPTGVVGIYSDPSHVIALSERRSPPGVLDLPQCSHRGLPGTVGDRESAEVSFVKPGDVDLLPMGKSARLRIQHFLEHRSTPFCLRHASPGLHQADRSGWRQAPS